MSHKKNTARSIPFSPDDSLLARAVRSQREGRLAEAEELCEQFLRASPNHAPALHLGGLLALGRGENDLAVRRLRASVCANKRDAATHVSLGTALALTGDRAGAKAAYEQALKQDRRCAEALNNLGLLCKESGDLAGARAYFAQAVEARPGYAEALNNLGTVLPAAGDPAGAADALRRALVLTPGWPLAHNNLGVALHATGDLAGAETAFAQAIRLAPDLAEARYNRSMVWLAQGDFARGWAEYRWGLQTEMRPTEPFDAPTWIGGGGLLAGRTLLVHAEQGAGDTFQFARYLPLVKERSGADRVLFVCHDGLGRVLGGLPNVDQVLEWRAFAGSHSAFDLQVPLLNLPSVFGTTVETVPSTNPYLHAEPDRVERWRTRLAPPSRGPAATSLIGIAWAGNPGHRNDHNRSCTLADFAPLARLANLQLVSLQKGEPARQADRATFNLVRLGDELDDWADTAAAIRALDLVITVDTGVAHLAGALGKPVWVLLPHAAEWRWLENRDTSPWYPTMRLFRQTRPGDWAGVLTRVATALGSTSARLDVLLVVHDQLNYVRACVASLLRHTTDFHLWIWDNASSEPTRRFLEETAARHANVALTRGDTNQGFIVPNNRLVTQGNAPYVVLLNSDTQVEAGWDDALIAFLAQHPDVGEVGYEGGLLGPDGVGVGAGRGADIDYVAGWCACFPRPVYETLGLFNEQLDFAYGKDSDFSLRLLEAGYKVHALSPSRVTHWGNGTIREVIKTRDTSTSFAANHRYLQSRWADYLARGRVLARAVETQIKAAEEKWAAGEQAEARALFADLAHQHPANARVLNNLGVALWQANEPQQALSTFLRALHADPNDQAAVLNCVDVLCAFGMQGDARLLCQEYLRRHPDNREVAEKANEL